MEGKKLVGESAEERPMDKGVRRGRLSVNTKGEFSRGNRHGEVQKVDLGSSYFSCKLYGRVERIYELKELTNRINRTGPHTKHVTDISPPKGNICEKGVVRLEDFSLQLIHEYFRDDGAQW